MPRCRCEGLDGLDLLLCSAPPEGEYETEYELSKNIKIIINKSGIFIKQVGIDDFLPFTRTVYKKVTRKETLAAYGLNSKDKLSRLVCLNIENLLSASEKGSLYARRLVSECESLFKKYYEKYCST